MANSLRSNIKVGAALVFCIFVLTTAALPLHAQSTETSAAAVEFFEQGQEAHSKGDLKTAVEFYDRALEKLPEFPEALYQKGAALVSLGDNTGAETCFRKAVELRPDWTLALSTLGTLLVRAEKFVEAESLLKKAISIDAASFPAYAGLAELRIVTKADRTEIRTLLDQIRTFTSKANPTAGMWFTRASLENALGETKAAQESIARAKLIDPGHKASYFLQADIAIKDGDLALADENVKALERLKADAEEVTMLKARVLALQGKSVEGREMLLSLRSNSPRVRDLISTLSAMADRPLAELELELAQSPQNAAIIGSLCAGYRTADPAKAIGYCQRAINSEPGNINHSVGLGAALLQAKRYPEAIDQLSGLLVKAPDNSTIRANLAAALFQAKRYPDAKLQYQWLTTNRPELAIAYYFLALCHEHTKEYMDAAANYNLFLKHADAELNRAEIENARLRLTALDKLIKRSKG